MNKLMLAAFAALTLSPAPAPAQVGVQINVNIPVNPPLVVVQPGIQVVEDWDEEVFFTAGFYWVRRDAYWYRAPSPRATWVYVEPSRVPPGLVKIPPGHYKHYRKDQAKAQKKARKQQEKHGKGHGHD